MGNSVGSNLVSRVVSVVVVSVEMGLMLVGKGEPWSGTPNVSGSNTPSWPSLSRSLSSSHYRILYRDYGGRLVVVSVAIIPVTVLVLVLTVSVVVVVVLGVLVEGDIPRQTP